MTDSELELAILQRYVEQHDVAGTTGPKCAREMDMTEVISGVTGQPAGEELVKRWYARLAPRSPPGVLRPCGDSTVNSGPHQYHARAYYESGSAPAWERISQLESQVSPKRQSEKEMEQKFGILCSPRQALPDFASYCSGLSSEVTVGVLFLDIDNFKTLNTSFTEAVVDREILVPFQKMLRAFCAHRGETYRHGGEEFLVLLPNQMPDEVKKFANRLCKQVSVERFSVGDSHLNITVSIGVALWPKDGTTLDELIGKANAAEHKAKDNGRNRVEICGEGDN